LINLKEIRNKIFKKENFYFLFVLLFIFSIDRYSKIKIVENFSDNVFFINEFLNFDLVWNTGIGFGLLSSDSSLYYNLISLLIFTVIVFLIFLGLKSDKFDKIIFSVIIGGALGNFYDRITFKAVPDFIDFHYGNFHWFTFNVADIFITIGIICFIMKEIFIKSN
jgi:signal peptidase II